MHQLDKGNKTLKSHITNTQESQEEAENVKSTTKIETFANQ